MFFQGFDEALLEAVDFAFCFLGRSTREAVYFDLGTASYLPRLQIRLKLEEFEEALHAVSRCGAGFLEELILRRLCETLEVEVTEDDDFDLFDLVARIERFSSSTVALVLGSSEPASTTKKTGR